MLLVEALSNPPHCDAVSESKPPFKLPRPSPLATPTSLKLSSLANETSSISNLFLSVVIIVVDPCIEDTELEYSWEELAPEGARVGAGVGLGGVALEGTVTGLDSMEFTVTGGALAVTEAYVGSLRLSRGRSDTGLSVDI